MLKISLEVKKIDYEKTFKNLIPKLTKELKEGEVPTEVTKLVNKLGDDLIPIGTKLLSFLDTDTRDQLLAWILEMMQASIVKSVNKALFDYLGGEAISIGVLYAIDKPGTGISLCAGQVKTDTSKLADSPALTGIIGGVAKLAFSVSDPKEVEKDVIKLLSADYVKSNIVLSLSEGLEKAGLAITLDDLLISADSPSDKIPHIMDPEKDEGLLPDAIEDKLIDALVSWLKRTLLV